MGEIPAAQIRQHGLQVPEHISAMAFDNYPFSLLTQPQLTALEADIRLTRKGYPLV